jgi:hypothetical protein
MYLVQDKNTGTYLNYHYNRLNYRYYSIPVFGFNSPISKTLFDLSLDAKKFGDNFQSQSYPATASSKITLRYWLMSAMTSIHNVSNKYNNSGNLESYWVKDKQMYFEGLHEVYSAFRNASGKIIDIYHRFSDEAFTRMNIPRPQINPKLFHPYYVLNNIIKNVNIIKKNIDTGKEDIVILDIKTLPSSYFKFCLKHKL